MPEEKKVIEESKKAVQEAKKLLYRLEKEKIIRQLSMQYARYLLGRQEELVLEFRNEGVLSHCESEKFFEEIDHDLKKISDSEYQRTYGMNVLMGCCANTIWFKRYATKYN